ncbi:hypothetical protein JHK87_031594 [Glycine soja]|nr:hypothetical protein JHK87_031594 [Glycine soja]
MASSSFICLCFVFTLISCFGLGIPTDQPLVLYGDTHNNPSTSNIEHHHQWSQDKVTHPISTHVKFSSSVWCTARKRKDFGKRREKNENEEKRRHR